MPGNTPPRSDARTLRIIIGADTFPPDINGAARFGCQLARGLAGRGHEVHVIAPAHPEGTAPGGGVERDGEVIVHRLASHGIPTHDTFRVTFPWQIGRPVRRLVDEIAPDAIHIQSHFLIGRALTHAARRRGIRLVATNHFMPENFYPFFPLPGPLLRVLGRYTWYDLCRVLSHADAMTTPTQRAADLLRDHGFAGPVRAISCGIDLARYTPVPDGRSGADDGATGPEPLRILFVGRLGVEKNVDVLLRAVARLPRGLRVVAQVVGEGDQHARLQGLAAALGIADRVEFLGLVSDAEVLAAHRAADVFCMPGTAELQSIATMEAMAAGTPVVAADAMALPHLVHDGENGFLFPPGDVAALADRLGRLAGSPELRRKMGAESLAIVSAHGLGHTLDAFEALYRG